MSLIVWSLIAGVLLHPLSKAPLGLAQIRAGGYDNRHPRAQQARLEGAGARALAAHQNQIEAFPRFAAGALAALATGVSAPLAGWLAIGWVVTRLVYLWCYLRDLSTLRSVVWTVGFVLSLALVASPFWARG